MHANAHMTPRDLRAVCRISTDVEELLRSAIQRLGLSARAYHRILKIARTIAAESGSSSISVTKRLSIFSRSIGKRCR